MRYFFLISAAIAFGCFFLVATSCKHARSVGELQQTASFSQTDIETLKKFIGTYCGECHINGSEGGFDIAGDLARLSISPLVVKGNPDASVLWQRIVRKSMPPTDTKQPSDAERDIVRRWILAGAPPSLDTEKSTRTNITPQKMLHAIAEDLKKVTEADRRHMRYLSLRHLYNQQAGGQPLVSDQEIEAHRQGLSVLVNSLHWRKDVTPLSDVAGTEGTVLRLDLRNYHSTPHELIQVGLSGLLRHDPVMPYTTAGVGLTASAWERLIDNDPYQIIYRSEDSEYIRKQTGTNMPFMRGDIFTFLAARSHKPGSPETYKFLYYKILGIPDNVEAFERVILKQTTAEALRHGNRIQRAGFSRSGVSGNNRLIERHSIPQYTAPEATSTPYWLSYDFASSVGRQQLESNPLGPEKAFGWVDGGRLVFQHDGGEVIFALPNGMHAYLLFTAKGDLLDEAPTSIVRDKKRIIIFNGISCMDCHSKGMIEKADTIRSVVDLNQHTFSPEELHILKSLYASDSKQLKDVYEHDSSSYLSAKYRSLIGGRTYADQVKKESDSRMDAILLGVPTIFDRFVDDVFLPMAAAEFDMDEAVFTSALENTNGLRTVLGSFIGSGKAVKRDAFREFYSRVVRALRLDVVPAADSKAGQQNISTPARKVEPRDLDSGIPAAAPDKISSFLSTRQIVLNELPLYLRESWRRVFFPQGVAFLLFFAPFDSRIYVDDELVDGGTSQLWTRTHTPPLPRGTVFGYTIKIEHNGKVCKGVVPLRSGAEILVYCK